MLVTPGEVGRKTKSVDGTGGGGDRDVLTGWETDLERSRTGEGRRAE